MYNCIGEAVTIILDDEGEENMAGKTTKDMTSGSPMKLILGFMIPMLFGFLFQQFYNMMDTIIVGKYLGVTALAAVGSTGSINFMIIGFCNGVCSGFAIPVAQKFGEKNESAMRRYVANSGWLAAVFAVVMTVVVCLLCRNIQTWMRTPEDIFDQAYIYIFIIFLGIPATYLYNMLAGIIRSLGDSTTPLVFLLISSVMNIILDLFTIIVLKMGVAGAAWATVISQYISAALVLRCLIQTEADYRLELSKLRVVKHKLCAIIQIGLPAGLQGAIFSISNVLIQSSINSFGSVAMAGSTASSNIEGFVYTAMNAIYQTALSFTSQNYGAGNFKRIKKIQIYCVAFVVATGLVLGQGAVFFGNELLRIYSSDPEVITYGLERLAIISGPYFLCGIMDVMVGGLRGLGSSVIPMFVSLTGACVFRVIWIYTIFAMNRTLDVLYYSYPVSWLITLTAHVITYVIIFRLRSRNQANVAGSSVAG